MVAVSQIFDRVKSVSLWSANIRKLAKDHNGYGSASKNVIDINKKIYKMYQQEETPKNLKYNNKVYKKIKHLKNVEKTTLLNDKIASKSNYENISPKTNS